jgi:hypothetical protein
MTMTKHIKDARVRHIGVRIHAKRPTLPIFAVVVVGFVVVVVVVVGVGVVVSQARLTDVTQEAASIDRREVAIVDPRSWLGRPWI